jgi:hypothetical protein
MIIRLLLAIPDNESSRLMHTLLDAALSLVPIDVELSEVRSRKELLSRVLMRMDDVVFLDWELAGAETPELVREVTSMNRSLRVVALLPLQLRQYRQTLWEAGACSGIPREHLDQELLSSLLCTTHRAMCREARLNAKAKAKEKVLKGPAPPALHHVVPSGR